MHSDFFMQGKELQALLSSQEKYPSPLRYPGGKAHRIEIVKKALDEANLQRNIYFIEPFAGGAGIGLKLMQTRKIHYLILNDIDYRIAAFFTAATKDANNLISAIEQIPVTVAEWRRQSKLINEPNCSILKTAIATLFLNRTSRGGILGAGCIGGLKQDGNYLIDARFNKKRIIEQITAIAYYGARIIVTNLDAIQIIKKYNNPVETGHSFFFIDPPYVTQGKALYKHFYNSRDHYKLSKFLEKVTIPFLLTYDNHPTIKELYRKFSTSILEATYSASVHKNDEELIISNQEFLTNQT